MHCRPARVGKDSCPDKRKCCCVLACGRHSTTIVPTGVPGDAASVGHPATAGAREGEADAPGTAEADHPDESPDASFLTALCPGLTAGQETLLLGPGGHGLKLAFLPSIASGHASSQWSDLPALWAQ